MKKIFKDPAFINVSFLGLLSIMQALSLLVLVGIIFSFIPFKPTDFTTKIFPVYLPEVRPEREMFLFRLLVLLSAGIMAAWVMRHKRHIDTPNYYTKYLNYGVMTAGCLFVQIFFIFKVFVFGDPLWARAMMYASTLATILAHIFWPELRKLVEVSLRVPTKSVCGNLCVHAGALSVLAILTIPNLEAVLARMFVRDQFYHIDSLIMMPGLAHVQGLLLNVDITSQYSVGIPIIFSGILNMFGQFDYPAVVACVIALCLCYYIAVYFFLNAWLKNKALSLFGILLAIKLQMFHWGVAPLVWQFPSATPLRHLPDIVFFIFLLKHVNTNHNKWLWGMVISVGFSLFWMMDVGTYLLGALIVYTALRHWQKIFFIVPSVLAVYFALMFISQPKAFWLAGFWHNQFEFASLFLQGWGALPMTEGLKDKQFFAFIIGFAIPIVYVFNGLYSLGQYFREQRGKDYLLLITLSVYGLGLYHYFIHRSGVTSYYAVCIPVVLIICFWLKEMVQAMAKEHALIIFRVLAFVMVPVIMTSYLYTFYPSIFNFKDGNIQKEIDYYHFEFYFKDDVALITSLTKPQERVAIVSSFETKMLLQSKRAPFFYYSPLMESSLMQDAKARLTYLHTYGRLNRTKAQIAQQKPNYIFIEQKLLSQQGQYALKDLFKAIMRDYIPFKEGKYLTAYQRKQS